MGLTIRFFIYREGKAKRIPHAKFQRFLDGSAEFPEYAGETLKMAEFVVNVENREVVDILRSGFFLQKVTGDGSQDKDFELDKMRYAINQIEPLEGGVKKETPENIIDASGRFEERRLDARCVWEPEYKVVCLLEDMAFGNSS